MLLLVGPTSPGFDLDRRLPTPRARREGARARRMGRRAAAGAAATSVDVSVNLRHPTMGEIGIAIRSLSAGQAAGRHRHRVVRRAPGRRRAQGAGRRARRWTRWHAALELLVTRGRTCVSTMGRAQPAYARRQHDLERIAELYAAVLERAAGDEAVDDAVLREVSEAAADSGSSPERRRKPARSPDGWPRSSLVVKRSDEFLPWAWLGLIVTGSAAGQSLARPGHARHPSCWSTSSSTRSSAEASPTAASSSSVRFPRPATGSSTRADQPAYAILRVADRTPTRR